MSYTVQISDPALADVDEIYEWLTARTPQHAVAWYNGLDEQFKSLRELPSRCPLAPEDQELPFKTRQLLYGHARRYYRIIFTIRQESVLILHVRHPARASFDDLI